MKIILYQSCQIFQLKKMIQIHDVCLNVSSLVYFTAITFMLQLSLENLEANRRGVCVCGIGWLCVCACVVFSQNCFPAVLKLISFKQKVILLY